MIDLLKALQQHTNKPDFIMWQLNGLDLSAVSDKPEASHLLRELQNVYKPKHDYISREIVTALNDLLTTLE